MQPNRLHADQAFSFASAAALTSAGPIDPPDGAAEGYELRFCSLFDEGRGYAFPCDAAGQVDLDALSERARSNYFYARALVGRDFSIPAVQACTLH